MYYIIKRLQKLKRYQGHDKTIFFSLNNSDYPNLPTIGSRHVPEEKVDRPQNFQIF